MSYSLVCCPVWGVRKGEIAMDDEMIAAILMIVCFVPVSLWLTMTGCEHAMHRWVRPWIRKNRILYEVAQYSRGARIRQNQRVMR